MTACLELRKALWDGIADVDQCKRVLELELHSLPLLLGQRIIWLHMISLMLLYTRTHLLKPSNIVSMVAKGEERFAFREKKFCWLAMAGMGDGVVCFLCIWKWKRDSEKRNFAAMVLNPYGLPLYISTSHGMAGLVDSKNLIADGGAVPLPPTSTTS